MSLEASWVLGGLVFGWEVSAPGYRLGKICRWLCWIRVGLIDSLGIDFRILCRGLLGCRCCGDCFVSSLDCVWGL